MWVPFLEDQPPKFGMAKQRPNFGAISDNFRIDREYLRNVCTYLTSEKNASTATTSTLDKRNLVNFGPQTKKF